MSLPTDLYGRSIRKIEYNWRVIVTDYSYERDYRIYYFYVSSEAEAVYLAKKYNEDDYLSATFQFGSFLVDDPTVECVFLKEK